MSYDWIVGLLAGIANTPILTSTPTRIKDYLTFASAEPFTVSVANSTKNWDGTLYYSVDAEMWNVWSGDTTLFSDYNNGEYRLYMCGVGNTKITGYSTNYRWVLSGTDIRCSGNIETLLDYPTVVIGEHPVMSTYCYYYMFLNCTSLTTPPELPATTLANYCYSNMFDGCTSLTTAPELPATTLANYCYSSMFKNCTSLTTPPELPTTTLANYCYYYMFLNCTSLTTPPELPATTLANECYYSMFKGCKNIKLSTTKSEEYNMEYCIPSVGDGTTATDALKDMFYNTGGTFTGTPSINTTYYMANTSVLE